MRMRVKGKSVHHGGTETRRKTNGKGSEITEAAEITER
jgi:hypothetical protein